MRDGRVAAFILPDRLAPAARPLASSQSASGIAKHSKADASDALVYILFTDIVGATLSALTIFHAYARPLHYDPRQLWFGISAFAPIWLCSAWIQKLYVVRALLGSVRQLLLPAVATFAMTFGVMLFLGFGLNLLDGVSRVWFLAWAASVLVWVGMTRIASRGYLQHLLRRGAYHERALVLAGSAEAAHRLGESLAWQSNGHVGVAALAALPGTPGAPTLNWIEDVVRDGCIDRVIIGSFSGAMTQANAVLARLTRLAIHVTLLPDLDGLQAPVLNVDRIGTLPAVDLHFRPLTPVQVRLKRAEDLIIASLLLIFVMPVLLLTSLAIVVDSRGPVFFRQNRAGFNGRTFRVWKFRSMYTYAYDERGARQTSRGDPRVTRVGRFLRRTSIDELPQLFNVLTGDMSLVGPRPHPLGMTAGGTPLDEVIEEYTSRHRLKPGITGWAQINGSRGEVDSHDKLRRRVSLDCHYIENWSLGFDLWIILRTALMLCRDSNAY